MKAAIRETRYRLAVQVAQTADHAQLLLTTPSSSSRTEAPVGGVVAGAIKAIALCPAAPGASGRMRGKRASYRRAVIGGVTVAIAATLATRKRRR